MKDYAEVIPLGGLGEFGMNCAALRSSGGMILIDAGMTFPQTDLGSGLGVNVVVPDITFLRQNKDELKAIFLTHGHEDHIGAVSYIVEELPVPVYGSPLTLGLVKHRLLERNLLDRVELRVLEARRPVDMAPFRVEPLLMTHSFPESFAFAIDTPGGKIVWSGDFKFDQTPVDGQTSDLHGLASHGEDGVAALFSDSTNSQNPGLCGSEMSVMQPLRDHFLRTKGRLIVSCFASSIHRIQIVLDLAAERGRRVAAAGRSLVSNIEKASELGYLNPPPGVLISLTDVDGYDPEELVLLVSGSQGEPMSALSRLAVDEFRGVRVAAGDVVILSARVIPGNEKRIANLVNHFYRRGAQVVDPRESRVHVSGHAFREDLKLMINLTRPRFFVPIHGDYRQLKEHALLAEMQGVPPENIHLIESGDVLRIEAHKAEVVGKAAVGRRFIDEGHGGEVHEVVLRDRRFLSEDGFIVVVLRMDRYEGELIGEPELISRGFILMEESEELVESAKDEIARIIRESSAEEIADEELFKEILRKGLRRFLRKKTGKRPMILPVTLEI